ncbi:hypothetical protein K461DRAFT_293847 [Myriangium duriaei CBS 260.36]|uniref:Rhodopsin domain-containing protein n=1 Tax=Myriangium duriaei CBS 260.36 TaxID=1168546 RepID=A0A9P4J2L6_9PEZI|nr:hypothetical protein K461DRAFT_293847 [Myriangium duriaei CBS 260.36]
MANKPESLLALAVVAMVMMLVTMAIRVYVRVSVIKALGKDDWTMLLAVISFFAYLICQVQGIKYGTGRHIWDLDSHRAQQALQYWFLCEVFYGPATTLLKVSGGLFLLRITVNKIHTWMIHAFIAGSCVFGTFYVFLTIFQCTPVPFWWDLNPGAQGKCLSPAVFMSCGYLISVLNSAADFFFAILPIFIVRQTALEKRAKIAVCVLLGVASLACIATLVRTPYVHTLRGYKGDFLFDTFPVAALSTIEVGLGITAANAATFRPLIKRWTEHNRSRGETAHTANSLFGPRQSGLRLTSIDHGLL